jgi:hypothetical protein
LAAWCIAALKCQMSFNAATSNIKTNHSFLQLLFQDFQGVHHQQFCNFVILLSTCALDAFCLHSLSFTHSESFWYLNGAAVHLYSIVMFSGVPAAIKKKANTKQVLYIENKFART